MVICDLRNPVDSQSAAGWETLVRGRTWAKPKNSSSLNSSPNSGRSFPVIGQPACHLSNRRDRGAVFPPMNGFHASLNSESSTFNRQLSAFLRFVVVTEVRQLLFTNRDFLSQEKGTPFRVEDIRLNRKVQPAAFPKHLKPVRHWGVNELARRFHGPALVYHL